VHQVVETDAGYDINVAAVRSENSVGSWNFQNIAATVQDATLLQTWTDVGRTS